MCIRDRDGSSKFSKDNNWATFPSVSGAYRLTGEEFMKNQKVFDLSLIHISRLVLAGNSIIPEPNQNR